MTNIRSSILLALALGATSSLASAAKVDKHAPLYANMDAASQRYQEASRKYQAGDDASKAAMTKALEDIEDLAQACLKQRGCDTTRVLTVYEALIKARESSAREVLVDDDPVESADPDHMASPVLANSPEAVRSLAMLGDVHDFDKLVQVNEPVQAALRDWLTSQRAFLIDAWVNYQYMRYLMAPEYERAGLPEALLFGIMAKESGGKVHSTSRSGASGPLQFMPATGTRFGLYRDETGFDSRLDPQQAARANAAYINERFATLNRNLEYTVAAYNGGEGRAARLYAGNSGASLWSPQVYAQLPQETRDYVPAVIAAAWLFLHPKQYGLQFPKVDTTPGTFTLARAASINELTICLGNGGSHDGWFRVLRNLNPRYEPQAYIPAGTVLRAPKQAAALYPKHCVQGPRAMLAQELIRANKLYAPAAVEGAYATSSTPVAAASAKPSKRPRNYQVRPGDSLLAIAREHSCDVTSLAKANKLKSPNYMIKPGQRLKLQGCEN